MFERIGKRYVVDTGDIRRFYFTYKGAASFATQLAKERGQGVDIEDLKAGSFETIGE